MERRRADKWLNDWMCSILDCLPGAINILGEGAPNRTYLSIGNVASNQLHRLKFARARDGEPAIEGIKAHVRQRARNLKFFFWEIVNARSLLTIAQRRFVKLDDAGHVCLLESLQVRPIFSGAHNLSGAIYNALRRHMPDPGLPSPAHIAEKRAGESGESNGGETRKRVRCELSAIASPRRGRNPHLANDKDTRGLLSPLKLLCFGILNSLPPKRAVSSSDRLIISAREPARQQTAISCYRKSYSQGSSLL